MKELGIPRSGETLRWFRILERKGLIRTMTPPASILRSPRGKGAVASVYSSSARFGPHKLICVKPDSPVPKLNTHPDNEEFILIDPRRGARDLYLLIGCSPARELKEKAAKGTLAGRDFVLLKMDYGDPRTSVFTMCAGTLHCEIVFPGKGPAPVFFVAEPRDLPMDVHRFPGYSFCLTDR